MNGEQIIFIYRSSYMTYQWVCIKSNTMGVTYGAGSACPAVEPAFIHGFSCVRAAWSLVFCVVFYRSLFVILSFVFLPLCFIFLYLPLRFDPTFLHRKRVDIINEYAINLITLSDLKCLNTHWSNGQHYLVVALTVVLHHSHNN